MSEYTDMSSHRPHTDPLVMTCPRLRWREVRWVLVIAAAGLADCSSSGQPVRRARAQPRGLSHALRGQ